MDTASAASFLSEDQFQCSICLDVFTEPVSIPCGHNFCKACITRHWEKKELCRCPLCSEKFDKGLKLRVNTGFREVVENFKQHQVTAKNDVPVKPGQVPCDCCTGKKFKASKTCLVCLASYCETHLEPHHRVAGLKRHKLTDPVHNLENNVCKIHNTILELFCRTDQIRVCVLCTEHSAHDTVLLEEEYEERKCQLVQKKMGLQGMIRERQKKVQEIKEDADTKRRDKDEAIGNSIQVFTSLVTSIQHNMARLVDALEEKHRAAERQAEVLVGELETEINELQRRITRMEDVSQTEDHFQLIKRFPSFFSSSPPPTKNWSNVSINGQHGVEDVNRAVVKLEEALTREMERAGREFRPCFSKILLQDIQQKMDTVTDLQTLPEGVRLDTIRRQYTVDMTFDSCTANDLLLFSDDFKKVQTSHIWWLANRGPQKFNRYAYVLGKRGFSEGRSYYEVQAARKTGWDIGVVRESTRGQKTVTLAPRNGAWVIRLKNNTKFSALNNLPVNLSLIKKPERIGVFVDYEKRLVSFYDVDTATLIYSFTGCLFNEKIYPFFSPGLPEDGINCAPLVLSPSKTSPESKTFRDVLALIFTVIFLVFISRC